MQTQSKQQNNFDAEHCLLSIKEFIVKKVKLRKLTGFDLVNLQRTVVENLKFVIN